VVLTVFTGYFPAAVAEMMQPGMSVSYVARRHGLSPSLVFRWRQLMSEGGKEAVRVDDNVVAAFEVRRFEERVRELERLLGRKTMEVEILKEALDLERAKKTDPAVALAVTVLARAYARRAVRHRFKRQRNEWAETIGEWRDRTAKAGLSPIIARWPRWSRRWSIPLQEETQ
jgi:transposase